MAGQKRDNRAGRKLSPRDQNISDNEAKASLANEHMKDNKAVTIAIVPAVILAIAGIFGSFLSYKVGTDTIRLPMIATQTAEARARNTLNIPIGIDARQSWQPSGFRVQVGDIVKVQVVAGKWTGWRDSSGEFQWSENSGAGFTPLCDEGPGYVADCPIKRAKITALIARVGSSKYSIGNQCTFQVAADGILEFEMNDDFKDDNYGVLAITITKLDSGSDVDDIDVCGFRSE